MTRHFGVATIYHRGCIYHPSRGCIYHRGGDFAIAVAMTRAMVISNTLGSRFAADASAPKFAAIAWQFCGSRLDFGWISGLEWHNGVQRVLLWLHLDTYILLPAELQGTNTSFLVALFYTWEPSRFRDSVEQRRRALSSRVVIYLCTRATGVRGEIRPKKWHRALD
jgi:hypothetical protein